MRQLSREQFIFLGLLLLLFAWAAFEADGFSGQARLYPFVVALAGLVIAIVEFGSFAFSQRQQDPAAANSESLAQRFVKATPYLAWLAGLYAAIYVIGMVISSGLFAFLFLLSEGKLRWYYALLSGILVIVFLIVMQDVMSLKWPKSLMDPLDMMGLG